MSLPADASRVEGRVELTEADVLHALQSMPERRFGVLTTYLLAAVALSAVGFMKGFDPILWVTTAFVAVLLVFTNLSSTRLQARRFFKDIDTDKRETAYVFTPLGLEITTKNSHVKQDYDALKRYVLKPHTLLLYSSSSVAQIIPLRAFSPADRERVIAWVQAQVKLSPKVPNMLARTAIIWLVLVVTFLAIWWSLN